VRGTLTLACHAILLVVRVVRLVHRSPAYGV
jgi:hypothetical protein